MAEARVRGVVAIPSEGATVRGRRLDLRLSPVVLSGILRGLDVLVILVVAAAVRRAAVWLGMAEVALDRCLLSAALLSLPFVWRQDRAGAYRVEQLQRRDLAVSRVAVGWFTTVSVGVILVFLTHSDAAYPRGWVVLSTLGAWLCLAFLRMAEVGVLRRWRRLGVFARNVAVFGAGPAGTALVAELEQDPACRVRGLFEEVPADPGRGTIEDLVALIRAGGVAEVIAALDLQRIDRIARLIETLRPLPVTLRLSLAPLNAAGCRRLGFSEVAGIPTAELLSRPLEHWSAVVKRIEDVLLSLLLLVPALPVMALIALLVRLTSRGPALFVQERFGFNNQVIRVLKFRTMHVSLGDASGGTRTVRGDPRVTPLGRWLRMTSLDELPQLINVLRGDMSLVGPRPHPLAMRAGGTLYQDAVGAYFARHRVKPGMTGWAQINGCRGEIDSLEKARRRVELDLDYIDSWSVWLDLKILVRSVSALAGRHDAY